MAKVGLMEMQVFATTPASLPTTDYQAANKKYVDTVGTTTNSQTGTSYTIAATDANKIITMSNASANSLYVPVNSSVSLPIGFTVTIKMIGAGVTTIDGSSSITIDGASGGNCIMTQWQGITLVKTATDTWIAFGGTFA